MLWFRERVVTIGPGTLFRFNRFVYIENSIEPTQKRKFQSEEDIPTSGLSDSSTLTDPVILLEYSFP
jgi:hypothetical protein